MVWIGQSTLEINRDSVYVIVKDNTIRVREQLTEEEQKRFGTSQFMDHLAKKSQHDGGTSKDALFQAAQSAKVDYSKNSRRPEKGIKITVGGPQPKEQEVKINVGEKQKDEKKEGEKKKEEQEEAETDEEGGVYIEALF